MKIPLRCSCLIDQDRYIGGDPVGYACSNEAKWEHEGVLFCDRCKEMLQTEPLRIRISPTGKRAFQEATLKSLIDSFKLP